MVRIKYVKIIALVAWMSIIFMMSHMPVETSWKLSGAVTSEVIHSVDNDNQTDIDKNHNKIMGFTKDQINVFIRKIAHMGEFGVLFLLWYAVLVGKNKNVLLYSAILSIFYAMTDEFHQLFVQGRTANWVDVVVDSVGVLGGVVFIVIVKKIVNMVETKRLKPIN